MRDRLIELLNKKYDHFCDQCGINKDSHYVDSLADYLIENGVIVPPCKVGDAVYWIDHEEKIQKQLNAIKGVVYFGDDNWKIIDRDDYMDELGTRYSYLTREEAEKALKGGDDK